MEILVILSGFWLRKTKPISSFGVLRAVYRGKQFEKTKPIYDGSGFWVQRLKQGKGCLKKQSQFAGYVNRHKLLYERIL